MSHPAALLLFLAIFIGGCEEFGGVPAGADLSTPKSAALVYLKAIQRGDSHTARAVSVGSFRQKLWVDALVTLVDGIRKYDNAMYARFGRISSQMHTDLGETLRMLADDQVAMIDRAKVSGDDQKARIDPLRHGWSSRALIPIYLLHEKNGWKIDLAQTYAEGVPLDKLGTLATGFEMCRRIGEIFQSAAYDVKAGQFRSHDEAVKALKERLADLTAEEHL